MVSPKYIIYIYYIWDLDSKTILLTLICCVYIVHGILMVNDKKQKNRKCFDGREIVLTV